jgi:hypothetical protein
MIFSTNKYSFEELLLRPFGFTDTAMPAGVHDGRPSDGTHHIALEDASV